MVPAIHPDDAWSVVRNVQSATRSMTFRDVCGSIRNRTVHNIEQEPDQYQDEGNYIDTVNINSINFNTKHSVKAANPKTSSNQVSIIVPYKVDTSSDRNIVPLYIYKKTIS